MAKYNFKIRRRIGVLGLLFCVVFVLLAGRLAYLQLIKGDELASRAEDMRTRSIEILAERGTIYDRNEKKLAISVGVDSIYVNPPAVKKSGREEEVANMLSETLGLDKEKVLAKVTKDSSFEWIKRKANFEQAQIIKEANLPGVHFVEETQRFYPKDQLAAHVLGFSGIDNQGLSGIEFSMNDELSGVPGKIITETDSLGVEIPQSTKEFIPPVNGNSLVLTIDETLQYFAERELQNIMNWEKPPKGATILMMNPNTGEVLAMANVPTYNPNEYSKYTSLDYRNKAVIDVYEPGSTFKMITAATALDSGAATINSRYYSPGYIMIGNIKMKCWRHYRPHGSQSFAETLQNSCNPCLVQMAFDIEKKEKGLFYKYIRNFGYGEPTGIALPGEGKGLLIPEKDLIPINIGNISIGQSIAVTPIQMITAASAVVNGGKLLKPQIVRQELDHNGNVIKDFQVEEVRQVISPKTSELMRGVLESVVSEGTAGRAYIEGFRVGGKTGTAQKPGQHGYQDRQYTASFLGFAPANDPQLMALVIIDEPDTTGPYQGGQIAAPVFNKLMEDSLRYWGVVPQKNELEKVDQDVMAEKTHPLPDVTNLAKDSAIKTLQVAGFVPVTKGEGDVVVSQSPNGFTQVAGGKGVVITLGKAKGEDLEISVPDLTGKRVREAAELLDAMGLQMKSTGVGTVYEQYPVPGTKVKKGDIINITLGNEEKDPELVGP